MSNASQRFGKVMRGAALALLGLTVLGAIAAGVGWMVLQRTVLADLPADLSDLSDWRPPTVIEVRDAHGEVIDQFYLERRYWVPLDALPDHVWQAFVAAEDRRFFEHPGVDLFGVARALAANLSSGSSGQGGSTLTQQLVKNLLLTPERSYERKLKEAVLAWRLERELSKEEILQLYVNYVYLGSGNYGVEAAAQDFFGVPASELDAGEAALLAGLVPAPSRYSPRASPELARWRRSLVLRRMLDDGLIDEIDTMDFEEAAIRPPTPTAVGGALEVPYITQVRRELRRLYGDQLPFERGLTVWTPYVPEVQEVARAASREAAAAHLARQGPRAVSARSGAVPPDPDPTDPSACFRAQVPADRKLGALRTTTATWSLRPEDHQRPVYDEGERQPLPLRGQLRGGELLAVCLQDGTVRLDDRPWAQVAAVVLSHATGAVVAVHGSTDPALEGFVHATQARRQPGSSFKPYVYAAALRSGRSPTDVVLDAPLTLPGAAGRSWRPRNYGGGFAGPVSLRRALASSLNTVAVRMALEVGPDDIVSVARGLGVATPLRSDLTVALGSSEVTPLDQAVAYGAIARLGVPREPVWIDRITAHAGGEVRVGDTLPGTTATLPGLPGPPVYDPGVGYELLDMMREVVRGGTARRAWRADRDRAGKTGTTNEAVDAWFVGITPTHTVVVWVGTDGLGSLGERETGGRAALPAWLQIVEALGEPSVARFPVPDEIVLVPFEGQRIGLRRGRVPERVLSVRLPGPGEPLPAAP